MNAEFCSSCSHCQTEVRIKSPSDLKRVLNAAKSSVDAGQLTPVAIPDSYGEPYDLVLPNGPWSDFVHLRFKCTACSQMFEVGAETYHGSGGSWKMVTS